MNARPLISVVMPTFNRLCFVGAAVASVCAQTFENWELLIVDDGSDDDTCRLLRALSDPRIIVEFHVHTGIPAVIRNRGIALARGRYIAFLDSDDRWAADKLRRQLALMESAPARQWSYTGVHRIDADGRIMDPVPPTGWVPYDGSIVEQLLRIDAHVAMPTVMADLELVRDVGGFDEKMRFAEDYDLWVRLAIRSEVSVDPAPLSDVRNHPEQFTRDQIDRLGGWVEFYTKMERLLSAWDLRALCRRRKREHLLLLAAVQARTRNWAAMRQSLILSAQARAWSPRGWLRVAKAAALSRGIEH